MGLTFNVTSNFDCSRRIVWTFWKFFVVFGKSFGVAVFKLLSHFCFLLVSSLLPSINLIEYESCHSVRQ